MASVTLSVSGKRNPSPIVLRFTEGKQIDIEIKTGLVVNPAFWDKKNRKIRNVIEMPQRDELNKQLAKLQIAVVEAYSISYSQGAIINRHWLADVIAKFFNRPQGEFKNKIEERTVYLSDYADWWLKTVAPTFKVKADKYMSEKTIGHYERVLESLLDFQGKNKIELRSITDAKMDEFAKYMRQECKYAESYTARAIGRIKFFCARAESDNLQVNKKYKERVFVKKEEDADFKQPYLNEEEITKIYKVNLSHDPILDHARDNLIIGLRTGLRIGDFLRRLDIHNIKGRNIEIRTQKTGYNVAIPIHNMVSEILRKHNGFPKKVADQAFNEHIKKVGQLAEIDDVMKGSIVTSEEKGGIRRKKIGFYKKYLLFTSHICRRSFATNNYGKISNRSLMDICGWKKEEQMLAYMKQTSVQSAEELRESEKDQYI